MVLKELECEDQHSFVLDQTNLLHYFMQLQVHLFLALCDQHSLTIFSSDVTDTYTRSLAPDTYTYLSIDNAYAEWYLNQLGKVLN